MVWDVVFMRLRSVPGKILVNSSIVPWQCYRNASNYEATNETSMFGAPVCHAFHVAHK